MKRFALAALLTATIAPAMAVSVYDQMETGLNAVIAATPTAGASTEYPGFMVIPGMDNGCVVSVKVEPGKVSFSIAKEAYAQEDGTVVPSFGKYFEIGEQSWPLTRYLNTSTALEMRASTYNIKFTKTSRGGIRSVSLDNVVCNIAN